MSTRSLMERTVINGPFSTPTVADNQSTTSPSSNGHVLNSWKEIAQYMGLGIRTVQRYEVDLGLPVRRPGGKQRGSVMALSSEIDHWLLSSPTRGDHIPQANDCETFSLLLERALQHAGGCAQCNSRLHDLVGTNALRQSA